MKNFFAGGVMYECDDAVMWIAQDKESGAWLGYSTKPFLSKGNTYWNYDNENKMYDVNVVSDSWQHTLREI